MAEIVCVLMIALYYQHLRGVIFFFVEKVASWYSVAAGSDAETIGIWKIPSISFSSEASFAKEDLEVSEVYGRNPTQVTRIAVQCLFSILPLPFFAFLIYQSSHDLARWRDCLPCIRLSEAGAAGSQWGSPGAWSSQNWKSQCKARACWLRWAGCLPW